MDTEKHSAVDIMKITLNLQFAPFTKDVFQYLSKMVRDRK